MHLAFKHIFSALCASPERAFGGVFFCLCVHGHVGLHSGVFSDWKKILNVFNSCILKLCLHEALHWLFFSIESWEKASTPQGNCCLFNISEQAHIRALFKHCLHIKWYKKWHINWWLFLNIPEKPHITVSCKQSLQIITCTNDTKNWHHCLQWNSHTELYPASIKVLDKINLVFSIDRFD